MLCPTVRFMHTLAVQMALNEFADETWEEFQSKRLGFKGDAALELRKQK